VVGISVSFPVLRLLFQFPLSNSAIGSPCFGCRKNPQSRLSLGSLFLFLPLLFVVLAIPRISLAFVLFLPSSLKAPVPRYRTQWVCAFRWHFFFLFFSLFPPSKFKTNFPCRLVLGVFAFQKHCPGTSTRISYFMVPPLSSGQFAPVMIQQSYPFSPPFNPRFFLSVPPFAPPPPPHPVDLNSRMGSCRDLISSLRFGSFPA